MLNCQQVSSLPSFRSEETGTVKTVRVTNAGLSFHLYVKKRGKQFLKEQNIFHFKHHKTHISVYDDEATWFI